MKANICRKHKPNLTGRKEKVITVFSESLYSRAVNGSARRLGLGGLKPGKIQLLEIDVAHSKNQSP